MTEDIVYARELLELCYSGKHNELFNHISQYPQLVYTLYSEERLSLLHFAADIGNLDIVAILVSNGAPVNLLSTSGHSPLLFASRGAHLDIVKYLLAKGANPHEYAIQNAQFNYEIAQVLHAYRTNPSFAVHTHTGVLPTEHKHVIVPLKIDEFKAQKQAQTAIAETNQNLIAVKLRSILDVRILDNAEQFSFLRELFRNIEKGPKSDEDIQQLNQVALEWVLRINADKMYDEALIAAWFYLKFDIYDSGTRHPNFVTLEKHFLPFMAAAFDSAILQFNTVELCGKHNPNLIAHLVSLLDVYFRANINGRFQDSQESRQIVYILGLLKTYCDIRSAPQQAPMWISRIAIIVNLPVEQVLREISPLSFMVTGLKSIPEASVASLFFAVLANLNLPADPVNLWFAANLFPLSFLNSNAVTTLANEHVSSM